ncbi:probable E3 ubiquitin-protein ligase RNF217 [Acanthaster planci]|uniref:RBR-type E3 ubiquitin transferase n=1 Tax=Acanthaster planci TaxID=133434 RepID=A0A8B7YEX0_ACAPL|nr:probable E3 ubiquitin-protein ligase RNF217 [Acanthaster planci]XP_022091133.1 probable E3 ubiquitin-protein ligase RNF217 [Acanthaster planci]XP_022091134.1 probable E3 ubiquitin-protein ligase RNF217 [Acanthaster planci]XP_022091135.1 probable E3 ubiquitin-protein ligase RNF217 [Acanthaster planci]XP_022091137.1 probable E3 ubiquitin-protein ligase RNF217 [Acanthaster planci]
MEETHSLSEAQEKIEESEIPVKLDGREIVNDETSDGTSKKSLAKLSSLPSPQASPSQANPLRRSLSYPPACCGHVCRLCAGLCVCPRCPRSAEHEEDKTGEATGGSASTRAARPRLRRRQSGGSMRTCHRHKLACMRDSLPASLESLQEAGYVPVDTEPSVSATATTAHPGVLFPRAEQEFAECQVCLLETFGRPRLCCHLHVCDACLQWYIREKVQHRILSIRCPNPACSDSICREEIQHHLSSQLLTKFLRFLIEENSDPDQKTCPRCNHVANFHRDVLISKHKSHPDEQKVTCLCGMLWCFRCHSPWHENITCKQYQRGDRLLKEWAKEHHYGQPNANRCPKCKVYIQRSSGCDNMTCSQCRTSFCYRCGERFYYVKFFGNHYSAFSVFGCKYRLLPNKPVKRKLIRGAIFGCKIAAAPVCITLAVGVGCVLLVALGPAYATYAACREYKNRRYERKRRRQFRMHRQYMEYSHQLYSGMDRAHQELKPRAATLIDLPPSSWQPDFSEDSDTWTEV